ncbi:ethanolamine kinase-like protein [Hapsidospora chrysogenum ATCC 11550]|uniref:ethanolamine kinase n=1 Tax=Hapsidospora chrysogenum (strain ATCC 11550 / CBS 779.69 / DSM 880 / IAM 14645 / JCM 23072 / IMI 49137) TaxID=857340 RepID=A0A086T8S9_HAPC1|nr:ethanolamine kinase-like protein [Hapsidospora chrysogenum ATCC 11550]
MSPAATQLDLGRTRYIPLRYDSQDSQASALKLILTLMPDWAGGDSCVEFVRFTDGITNTLLKAVNRRPGLSKADIDRHAVLLRAYGSGTAILIDREREAANHELLMRHGLAPELLARFENGMLYRYIPGAVASPQDLGDPAILTAIARRLAEWHARLPCLHGPSIVPPNGNKQNGDDAGFDAAKQELIANAAPGKPFPNLWTTMQKWILALPTDTEEKRQRQALLQREMNEMVEKLSQRRGLGHNGLVFAHCDLLCANVIIHRPERDGDDTTVSFIDYEYATPSPAAFDVANHFAEWAGYDCDYSAVPTVSQRRAFICEYMKTYVALSGESDLDVDEEARRLMDEVDAYRGVPGFYWGIWAAIQAMISDIDFDYATYSESRLGEYWAFKAEEDGSRKAEGREMPLRERTWARSE